MLRVFDSTRAQLLLLAALFALSLPLVTTRIYASDEVQYFAYLRSLWFDHDVSFENEYQHFYDAGVVRYPGFHETFLERQTETGRRITFATIGSALLWSPFYAAADGYVRVARLLGSDVPADGYSPPYVSAVAYASAVYAWLAIVCGWLIARRVLGGASRGPADADSVGAGRASLWAALAVWIGTPLFFYMYIAPPMAHACSAFAVAAFVLVWLHARERWCLRGLILLGALAGLMGMVREQDLFIAIGPALDWAWTLWRRASGRDAGAAAARHGDAPSVRTEAESVAALLLHGLAGAIAFGIAYAPQLAAYVVLNGYPGPSRLVVRKMNFAAPYALGVLASPEHGLLFWTPLAALALVGLIALLLFAKHGADLAAVRFAGPEQSAAARGDAAAGAQASAAAARRQADARRIALCVLVMIASQIYIAGSVESWTVAGAFGQRRFVGLSALLVLGLAAFIRALGDGWPRRAGHVAIALTVWWNLGLMAQFGAGLMDRQRLELGRNTYNTFVTIPLKLPELAWRYVFARRSFYHPASDATSPGATEPASPPASPGDGRTR